MKYSSLFKKALGCEDIYALSCLQNKSLEEIFEHQNVIPGQIIWNAVPDYEFTDNPFLPGEVTELLDNGQFNHDIEVIIGSNKAQYIKIDLNLKKIGHMI